VAALKLTSSSAFAAVRDGNILPRQRRGCGTATSFRQRRHWLLLFAAGQPTSFFVSGGVASNFAAGLATSFSSAAATASSFRCSGTTASFRQRRHWLPGQPYPFRQRRHWLLLSLQRDGNILFVTATALLSLRRDGNIFSSMRRETQRLA
jgi:hypothetical protein